AGAGVLDRRAGDARRTVHLRRAGDPSSAGPEPSRHLDGRSGAVGTAPGRSAVGRVAAQLRDTRGGRGRGRGGARSCRRRGAAAGTLAGHPWGASIPPPWADAPSRFLEGLRARRPDVDPGEIIPVGLEALQDLICAFVDQGFSKFVLIPLGEPPHWTDE